jgi:hypothetical protein
MILKKIPSLENFTVDLLQNGGRLAVNGVFKSMAHKEKTIRQQAFSGTTIFLDKAYSIHKIVRP